MGWLRLVRRLILFGSFTLLAYLLLLLSTPVVRLLRGNTARWRARIFETWARHGAPLIGMRVHVKGPPPRPPFFLVSNHLSYVDILALASQTRCAFIAKAEIAGWPILGALCRSVHTLFIERESKRGIPKVLKEIERTLRDGVGVVLFPEATSSQGATVLPFRPSLLEAAARGRLPVSYATLTYRTPADGPPAHLAVCWWGDMTFGRHVLRLFRVREFHATVTFGEQSFREEDRKVLADKLRRAVEEQFEAVVPSVEGRGC